MGDCAILQMVHVLALITGWDSIVKDVSTDSHLFVSDDITCLFVSKDCSDNWQYWNGIDCIDCPCVKKNTLWYVQS